MTDLEAIRARDAEMWPVAARLAAISGEDDYIEAIGDRHALLADIDERQASFDLRWKADMRAIKMWQEAHPGNELVWPDHADLIVWLLAELDNAAGMDRVLDRSDLIRDLDDARATIDKSIATTSSALERLSALRRISTRLAKELRSMVAVYYETGMEDSEPVRALAAYDAYIDSSGGAGRCRAGRTERTRRV